jgi:hypothetical protein
MDDFTFFMVVLSSFAGIVYLGAAYFALDDFLERKKQHLV